MTKQLDKNIQQEIAKKYGTTTAQNLANQYNCTVHQVYEIGRRFKKQQPHNKEVNINPIQHQVLLGGWLGDGRFKLNGRHNVQYSECHALGEADYLRWKYQSLGELTENSTIYDKNQNDCRFSDAKEFTTLTTPSLLPYKQMTRLEVINELDELGLIIHLLDDGWFAYSNKERTKGRFCITTYNWTDEERQALIDQWYDKTGVRFYEHGIKRVNLGASSQENEKLFAIVARYFPLSLDIIKKKFKVLLSKV